MTATLTQVRQALKTRLANIPDLNVYAFQPGSINDPAAVIKPADGAFLTYLTSNTSHDLRLTIGIFVAGGDEQASTEKLDAYLADTGSQSVYATVAADPRLGGVVDGCDILSASGHGSYKYGDLVYWGVEFTVGVLL